MPDAQKVEQVWQWVTAMPKESLAQVGETYPALSPFITLRKLTEENAASPAELARNLQQFQQVYRAGIGRCW